MRRRRCAFTLVELLVVIGIIAALIALLMPALNRAMQQANRTKCGSNMHQLYYALNMYCTDNRSFLPGGAYGSATGLASDWIYWQPGRTLANSPLWTYMGKNVNLLTCPSDPTTAHPAELPTGTPTSYPYSYALNAHYVGVYSTDTNNPGSPLIQNLADVNGKNWTSAAAPITALSDPNEKILIVEGSPSTLTNGTWIYDGLPNTTAYDSLSVAEDISTCHDYFNSTLNGRTNVCFVDGHVDFMPRAWVQNSAHWLAN